MRAAWAHPKRTELNRMGSKGTATRPLSSGNVLQRDRPKPSDRSLLISGL